MVRPGKNKCLDPTAGDGFDQAYEIHFGLLMGRLSLECHENRYPKLLNYLATVLCPRRLNV